MKKILTLLLACSMAAITFVGCSFVDGSSSSNSVAESSTNESSMAESSTESLVESVAEESKTETTAAKYDVAINGAKFAEDYEGKKGVIISYTFTNNSDETTMAMSAVNLDVYQDGVELEIGITGMDSGYDAESALKKIKTGKSVKCEAFYLLTSEADLEIEISEFFDFSDNKPIESTIAYADIK